MDIDITEKQDAFINSTAFETLFGGAAGGGKSFRATNRCFVVCVKISKIKTDYIQKNIRRFRKIFNKS